MREEGWVLLLRSANVGRTKKMYRVFHFSKKANWIFCIWRLLKMWKMNFPPAYRVEGIKEWRFIPTDRWTGVQFYSFSYQMYLKWKSEETRNAVKSGRRRIFNFRIWTFEMSLHEIWRFFRFSYTSFYCVLKLSSSRPSLQSFCLACQFHDHATINVIIFSRIFSLLTTKGQQRIRRSVDSNFIRNSILQ